MPTAAECRVDLEAAGRRGEHRHDLFHQDRQMPILHLSSDSTDGSKRTLEARVVPSAGLRSPAR